MSITASKVCPLALKRRFLPNGCLVSRLVAVARWITGLLMLVPPRWILGRPSEHGHHVPIQPAVILREERVNSSH
jgi:hypothetical protein